MKCRPGCTACCKVVSISSLIPGMPDGKPAGVRCINLDSDNLCKIYNSLQRPDVCRSLQPSIEMCGENNEYADNYLTVLEKLTKP